MAGWVSWVDPAKPTFPPIGRAGSCHLLPDAAICCQTLPLERVALHGLIVAWFLGCVVSLFHQDPMALLIALASMPTILSPSPAWPPPSRAPSSPSMALCFAVASSEA